MIDRLVTQGYTLADIETMTLRQMFHFATLAADRLEAQAQALKRASGNRR